MSLSDATRKKLIAMDKPLLLTVDEAATLLRISRNSVYALVREHRLPHIRLGRSVRIPRRIFERWMEQQVGIPSPDPAVVSWSQEPTGTDPP